MTHIKSAALVSVLFSTLAQAALPFYWDRARHFPAIANDRRIETSINDPRYKGKSSGAIDGITLRSQNNGGFQYEVTSGACTLNVRLKIVGLSPVNGHVPVGPGKIELTPAQSLRCH